MAQAWKRAVAGAVGGLVGTAFMQKGMRLSARLPEPVQPPALERDPGEFVTERAEAVTGRELPEPARQGLAQGLHWAYGTFWPMMVGMAVRQAVFRSWTKTLAAGAGLGAGVWAIGFLGWLPGSGLMQKGTGRVRRQATALLSHVAYGVLSVAPLYLAARLFPPPRRRWLPVRR